MLKCGKQSTTVFLIFRSQAIEFRLSATGRPPNITASGEQRREEERTWEI